jgi:hypothetical protein
VGLDKAVGYLNKGLRAWQQAGLLSPSSRAAIW